MLLVAQFVAPTASENVLAFAKTRTGRLTRAEIRSGDLAHVVGGFGCFRRSSEALPLIPPSSQRGWQCCGSRAGNPAAPNMGGAANRSSKDGEALPIGGGVPLARDTVARRSRIRRLPRSHLDIDDAATFTRDHTDVRAGHADTRVVGIHVGSPDALVTVRAERRTYETEQLAVGRVVNRSTANSIFAGRRPAQ